MTRARCFPAIFSFFIGLSRLTGIPPGYAMLARFAKRVRVRGAQGDVSTRHAKGKTTVEHAFETDVWFKRKGEWRVNAVHYSSIAK